jgi:hypothetical protein
VGIKLLNQEKNVTMVLIMGKMGNALHFVGYLSAEMERLMRGRTAKIVLKM